MLCPHCRAYNPNNARVCERCAKPLDQADSSDDVTFVGGDSYAPSPPGSGGAVVASKPRTHSTPSSPSGSALFSFEPGSDFGPRYRIESILGEGGMGMVYKAHDVELDRSVAIKLIRPGLMTNENAIQRFKQELLLASKISHKNILRIHDLGDVEGLKFISMAFIEGQDLYHVLHTEGRLPIERALKFARQILDALDAAHSESVVHRDLKPQNILVDRNDQVFITDFGLAKSLHASAAGMTRSGEFLGTPRYMAPEQVEGKPIDNRTDLYACGLIFYEMVTGDVPFKAESALALMYQRVKEKPENPRKLNPEVPEYFERIIMRCLEVDPARRYQSARDILTDLDAQRARSRGQSVQISLPVPTSRNGIIAAGVVLALIIGVFAFPQSRHFIFRSGAKSSSGAVSGVPPLSEGKFIAVLPFRVLGNDPSQNYIAEGIEEALSAKLFQLKDVRVASTGAVERAGQKDSVEKVARQLGVNLVVDGMVQSTGDKIRVIVKLQDVAANRLVWSHEFSGVTQDLLTLEDQMYAELVSAMDLNPAAAGAGGGSRPTENIEAYDLYLKGRNSLRGQQDVKNVQAAIRFFEDALKKDSGFALAYAGMADASLTMYRANKDQFWAQRALGAAQRARELNEKLPEVHYSLGSVYIATGKNAEAVSELRTALDLAPNSDEGFRRLGQAYKALGKKDEAIQAYKKAIDINPYYWFNHNALGAAYLDFGENDLALAEFKRVTELESDNPIGWENTGNAYIRQGKWEECIPAFQKALALQPYYTTYSNLGTAYFFLKRYPESVQMFEKAVELNANDATTTGNLADALRASGNSARAVPAYDKAIALAYKELQVNPRSASTLGMLALFYAKKGDKSNAADFIRRARAIDRKDVLLAYSEAVVHALAGRNADALRVLREAFQNGYPAKEARSDPELKTLQSLPEFEKLMREFGG